MTTRRIIIFLAAAALVFFLAAVPGRKWARGHVNYKTAVEDHPLLCTNCHLYITKNKVVRQLVNTRYQSPLNIAVTADGKTILATAQDGNAVIVADAEKRKTIKSIKVGNKPHSIVIDKKGEKAYVSNQWSDFISVIDMQNLAVCDTLPCGNGPAGLALSTDGKFLYVVNSFASDISVVDIAGRQEIKRLSAGNNPTGAGISPDGRFVYVSARRAKIARYGEPLVTELTLLDDSTRRVSRYLEVPSAYLIENFAFTPGGDMALFTMIRPKNMVPSIQVERGWMMTHGFGVIEKNGNGRITQLLLDEPNAYYPDPFDIVVTPDGKRAFISSSGVNTISVVNLDSVRNLLSRSTPQMTALWADHLGISSSYVEARIKTGSNPKGLALSPDGSLLYVAEHLNDRIGIINTSTLETIGAIDLAKSHRITVARQGRRLLNNAGHTFQNQYSCYTCHPDEHEDGLVYNMASKDMGRNLTNTQSLRDIGDTPPFKWNGKNQTVYKQDGMRFSTVLTRTEQFSYKNLDAITAYIMRGIPYPPNLKYNARGELTEAQLRGKAIFERTVDNLGREIPLNNRCITCHPAPYYTNLKTADVSTLAHSDDSIQFDTPHLNNIFASPPYLHDGRAKTLEEIWTLYGQDDRHGLAGDMTKNQLNDLVEYLKSLRSPDYERESAKKYKAVAAH